MPLDVRRLKSDGTVVQSERELADGTAVAVGIEDSRREGAVARATVHAIIPRLDPDSFQDFSMQRTGKVALDEGVSEGSQSRRIIPELSVNRFREATASLEVQEGTPVSIMLAGSGDMLSLRDFPEAIVLQPPEGVLRMDRFAMRPELAKEPLESVVSLPVEH